MRIELSSPDITDTERNAVLEVLSSGRLSLGPRVEEFESAVANYCGTRFAVAVSSGTSALHLLMRAIAIQPGDEVITTPFSFVASSNCVLFERGRPVFVDIEPDTWNIDVAQMGAAISPRTRALLPVHVFGQAARMDEVRALATKHSLRYFEDSCEALGGTYHGRRAGNLAEAGVFGFYPNKQITTGEGGMITTNDEPLASLCRSMRNQGRDSMSWLAHERLGYNYRLSDINCAVGIAQMSRIDEILAKRNRAAEWYRARLSDERRIQLQRIRPECGMSWFVFVIKLSDDYREDARGRIIEQLRAAGIGCSNYFSPIHLQKFYREELGYRPGQFPVCERVAARTIALPFHGLLTESQVDEVCATLRRLL
ncbi:MAG: DegT/DnrJ/EryC1/StrS family aminotransferase [Phycisphaerae bacterium]|nr:DegT/DnrJ/EryC1/StrS family aminotransferase [Phycisphaerae bacterium]